MQRSETSVPASFSAKLLKKIFFSCFPTVRTLKNRKHPDLFYFLLSFICLFFFDNFAFIFQQHRLLFTKFWCDNSISWKINKSKTSLKLLTKFIVPKYSWNNIRLWTSVSNYLILKLKQWRESIKGQFW